jgi:acetyl esterase/lipase
MPTPPLDPELAHLADLDVGFGTDAIDLVAIRTMIAELAPAPPPSPDVVAGRVIVRAEPELTVETFAPTGGGVRPGLIWFHGGGYVIGSASMDAERLQGWARQFGCVILSVDYRLAPEHPYPAAHEDAVEALEWLIESEGALGVDLGRVVVGGASAGAGLAAALALAARDRGFPLAGQLLIYPMLDDRQQTPSSQWDVPVWPPAANEFGWRAYLGPLYGGEVPAYAAPARETDMSGMAPTLMVVGGADGFFDEDVDYAVRLTRAGVPTDLRVFAGAPHGFDLMAPESRAAHAAIDVAEAWLGPHLAGA